jgi:hypothetical protein
MKYKTYFWTSYLLSWITFIAGFWNSYGWIISLAFTATAGLFLMLQLKEEKNEKGKPKRN